MRSCVLYLYLLHYVAFVHTDNNVPDTIEGLSEVRLVATTMDFKDELDKNAPNINSFIQFKNI